MTDDTCIFYYHGCNWSDIPARQQYLMGALARYLPIVFFDGGTDRRYRVTMHRPRPNVIVVRGLTSVCQRLYMRGLRKMAAGFAAWHLRKIRQPYRRAIFWCAENWLRPYRFIRHDALVYDCIDPSFSDDPKRIEIYQQREREVLKDADHVFATADALSDLCRQHHREVNLLNNACEPAEYSDDLLQTAKTPHWWPATETPIAAYLGALDWRFDFTIMEQACRQHPNVHFILAGNILVQFKDEVRRLAVLPNVSCPGRISVEDGRYLLNHCAIGLIPFTVGQMNDAINPVKMYAYALLGKPMAGTAVRELVSRPNIVTTSDASSDFATAISMAMAKGKNPRIAAQLRDFALNNTWQKRAEEAWACLKA